MMTLVSINYDVWAELQKWPFADRLPRTGEVVTPDRVYEGTLAGCVKEFMAKPVSQRPLYEVFTEPQPAFKTAILSAADLLDIVAREDFPKD
jgi:hypothetical protein